MKGFLNVNKPAGMTSHSVVSHIRRLAGRGMKVGHAGTLDPAATGVLPVALGTATRLIEYLAGASKGYRAEISLGVTTTTDDAEGEPLEERPVPPLEREAVETALAPFRGTILQIPPMYAAVHHEGKRLYELARAGQIVERTPRPVTIDRLELRQLSSSPPHLVLDIVCGKGTYIRSLARDIGETLGCGSHIQNLVRTFVGPFVLDETIPLAALQDNGTFLAQVLLPPHIAVSDWEMVTLDAEQSRRVANGLSLHLPDLPGPERMAKAGGESARVRAHTPDGELLALLLWREREQAWHPEKVLHNP